MGQKYRRLDHLQTDLIILGFWKTIMIILPHFRYLAYSDFGLWSATGLWGWALQIQTEDYYKYILVNQISSS